MKKFISFVLTFAVLLTAFPFCAEAEINYECGKHATWSLDTATGELVISGYGEMYDYSYRGSPWYDYITYIKTCVVEEGITVVGKYAFASCIRMTSIEFPSSLIRIKSDALYNTPYLTSIDFPNGSNLCIVSEKIVEESKWYDIQPNGPIYIGNFLYGYKGAIPANTTLNVKEGTLGIASFDFKNQTNIVNINIPDSVFSIAGNTFEGSTWLADQPDGMVFAGKVLYTYKGVMQLGQKLVVPEGTNGLAGYALKDCDLLYEIVLPESLIFIGSNSFSGTDVLRDVDLPSGLEYIDDNGFETSSFKTAVMPKTLKYVGDATFSQSDIEKVVFEDGYSIDYLPYRMFYWTTSLSSVNIPHSVTHIDAGAFSQCWELKTITIPDTVKEIGRGNFAGYETEKVKISCYENSAAHNYAVENSLPFVLLDNKVNIDEVIHIIEKAEGIDRSVYTQDSLERLDKALADVDLSNEELDQDTVNKWKQAIDEALEALKYKKADYSEVESAKTAARNIDRSLYTPESLDRLDKAVSEVEAELDITKQETVSAYANAINKALEQLEYRLADYTRVNAAVKKAKEIDRQLYSELTLTLLDQQLANVDYTLDITQQAKVEAYVKAIDSAIASLEYDSVVLRHDAHGVVVSATTREIKKSTVLAVEKKDPSDYEGANFAVGGSIKSLNFYDINLVYGGVVVQPNGTVTVKIKLADGVKPERCRIYHVSDDPVDPLVRYASTLDGNYIVFETNHFSEFAVIEVEPVMESLELVSAPTKTVYAVGESIDLTGMNVQAVLSDGTRFDVSDYDVSLADMSSAGTKRVTVYYTYNGVTESTYFEITVEENTAFDILCFGESSSDYIKKLGLFALYSKQVAELECIGVPEGCSVEWSLSGDKFSVDENGRVTNKGLFGARSATVTAKLIDENGSVIAEDSIKIIYYKLSFQLSRFIGAVLDSITD